jgi:hypothetical protein
MKPFALVTLLCLSGAVAFSAETQIATSARNSGQAFHQAPAPPASSVAKSLLWIADARKMDEFLSQVNPGEKRETPYSYEVLPDTRLAWRDYARQAWAAAERGEDSRVADRIGQMLKLAALYREFGGLQNVCQAEEIRALAGRTVQQLGYGGRIQSPYLETSADDCLSVIERLAGAERGQVRPIFWQHLLETAQQSYARLSGQSGHFTTTVASAYSR